MLPDFVLGLDLAQAADWTALSLLERHHPATGNDATYDCTHLDRWRGESYTTVPSRVRRVRNALAAHYEIRCLRAAAPWRHPLPPAPHVALVVDRTGVGAAVFDVLKGAGLEPIGVTIHGGDLVTRAAADDFRTPKRDLAASVHILLQQRRLRIAAALPLAETLRYELENFKVTLSATGHDRYAAGDDPLSWREQPHDDLVLSVALAAWYAEYLAREMAAGVVRVGSWLPGAS
jgi:hypothetical protein